MTSIDTKIPGTSAGKLRTIHANIETETAVALGQIAQREDRSLSAVVRRILERAVATAATTG